MPIEPCIRVHGCVGKPGKVVLRRGTTVRSAVAAAGGFGGQGMKPTGVISIRSRRKSDGLYYKRRSLNYSWHPEHLDVSLRSDDIVIVQFDVDTWRPASRRRSSANMRVEPTPKGGDGCGDRRTDR